MRRRDLVCRVGLQQGRLAEVDLADLADRLPPAVLLRFAVGRDGKPSRFELLTDLPDPRMGAAIWQAIQECKWIAGADPQGKPTNIWVIPGLDARGQPQLIWMILPLKFAAQ